MFSKKTSTYLHLHKFITLALLSFLILFSSCTPIDPNKVDVTLKYPKTTTSPISLNATVSNVQIVNHQIIITGTNLSNVTLFKLKEGTNNFDTQIESQTNTSIVANTLNNVTFAAGKMFDFILSNATAASTFTVNFSLCDSTLGGKGFACSLTPNNRDVLSYNSATQKWEPRAVNGLSYQGLFSAVAGTAPTTVNIGDYYIINVAGTIGSVVYEVGDWIVLSATSDWEKIDNTNSILSVFGRTGAIVAHAGDYSLNLLGDVDFATPPTTNQFLKYNGTKWVPATISTPAETDPNVSAFAKTALPTCTAGQVLKSDGTSLSCVTDLTGAGSFSGAANVAVMTNGAGGLTTSTVTNTELGYVSGVTSAIQTQLNSKAPNLTGTLGGIPYFNSTTTTTSSLQLLLNGIVLGGGTSAPGTTSLGNAGEFLTSAGVAGPPVWTSTLPVANGGTGVATAATNLVFASPNGSSGAPSFRALVASDLPAGTKSLSGLTAATATNSIDHLNFDQTWNWSTITTGSMLNLTTSNATLNSTNGLFKVANTGASTNGILARLQSNSTAGSGLTVLTSGNVGVGTIAPASTLDVKGTLRLSGSGSGYVGFAPQATAGSVTYTLPTTAPGSATGYYLSSDTTGNLSWATAGGSAITALTNDVTATGTGSVAATVASVGGSTAANIHSAELLANAATNLNTASTIVKRDPSGNFSAGTITANVTGNATNVTGIVATANGGTGANITGTQGGIPYFNSASTMATSSQLLLNGIVLGGGSSVAPGTIGLGTSGQLLTSAGVGGPPTWTTLTKSLSDLIAATATNTIDHLNFDQTWNWSTITTGSMLNLTTSNATLNSTNGLFKVANTGASTNGILARLQSNSTAGSGLTVLTSGNVGVGTLTPGSTLDVKGTLRLSGSGSGYVGFAPQAAAGTVTYTLPTTAPGSATGYYLSSDTTGNLSWATAGGSAITALTSDVTASGTGSVAATVAAVGGSTAANVHAAELLANAATNLNTVSTIVKRDPSGNFSAGTITANVTGNATNVTGIVAVANGGTGANITPVNGGIIYSNATTLAVTPAGTAGQILRSAGASTPTWSTATYPATVGVNNLLFGSSANAVGEITTANSSILATNGSGVPSWNTVANTKTLLAYGTAANVNTGGLSGNVPVLGANSVAGSMCTYDVSLGFICTQAIPGGNLSGLSAATTTSTIDNLLNAITWNWSTATTQSPLTITANGLTTGSLLNLTTSNASVNSTNGLLNVANTGASVNGVLARLQSNSTAGSGMTVLTSGNVGIGTTSPTSSLQVAGAIATPVAVKTASYSLLASDSIIMGNATSGSLTLTLPSAIGASGRQYTLKKIDSSVNVITVATTSSQTIDGATTISLSSQWQLVMLASDGANWFITGSSGSSYISFAFIDVTGAALSALTTSSSVTAVGTGSSTLSVSGSGTPQISINGGAWGTSGTIVAGQTLAIRLTSSGSGNTTYTATIIAGTFSTTWNVTTSSPLFAFTTHTFTNAGISGRTGPLLSDLQTAYSAQSWASNAAYFAQGAFQGYQKFTIPDTGTYRFVAAGGNGSRTLNDAGGIGGAGAIITVDMALTKGDKIIIVVGQIGVAEANNGSAAGGTFVMKESFFTSSAVDSNIIVIAGGGANANYNVANDSRRDASLTSTGKDGQSFTAGTGGNGGAGGSGNSGAGGGGAGVYSNGGLTPTSNAVTALSLTTGAVGAYGWYINNTSGFGGGGAGGNHGGAGGGGYNGGGAGSSNSNNAGGGSSYWNVSSTYISATLRSWTNGAAGYVTITKQ